MLLRSFLALLVVLAICLIGAKTAAGLAWTAKVNTFVWIIFLAFVLNFFRDPDPIVPSASAAIVAPAHGTIDQIEESSELEFIQGPCRRISIFLSVFDVHVQQAPVAGKIVCVRHREGRFINALKADSARLNENVLIGFASAERPGEKVAVRLIAGWIARRILPWVTSGETVARGERMSMIQFGSRVDLYLPLTVRITARLGDKVRGGETVVALRT